MDNETDILLYQTTPLNITLHMKNIYEEGELSEEVTFKNYLQVRKEGSREVKRNSKHYNPHKNNQGLILNKYIYLYVRYYVLFNCTYYGKSGILFLKSTYTGKEMN